MAEADLSPTTFTSRSSSDPDYEISTNSKSLLIRSNTYSPCGTILLIFTSLIRTPLIRTVFLSPWDFELTESNCTLKLPVIIHHPTHKSMRILKSTRVRRCQRQSQSRSTGSSFHQLGCFHKCKEVTRDRGATLRLGGGGGMTEYWGGHNTLFLTNSL